MGADALRPEAHVFGATARRGGDWDARACIEGEYSHAAQQPDPDLGCSMTPGFRKDPSILAESNANIRQRGGSHGLEHVFGRKSSPFFPLPSSSLRIARDTNLLHARPPVPSTNRGQGLVYTSSAPVLPTIRTKTPGGSPVKLPA